MSALPTIRVQRDGARCWHTINLSDYDPGRHVACDEDGKALDDMPGRSGGEPAAIPDDWESLHWSKQEKLALDIVGGDGPLVPAEGQTRAEKAKAIIRSEVAGREGGE